ncbi:hypothetical protein [Paraburkholderia sp.]|uniref:hypothetical protein n=1 Tax=Paraburkholderia sp. TaxID=1926495 RepID=UPI003D6F3C06
MAANIGRWVTKAKTVGDAWKIPQFFAILFFCQKLIPAVWPWKPEQLDLKSGQTLPGWAPSFATGTVTSLVQGTLAAIVAGIIVYLLFAEEREQRSSKRQFFGFGTTPSVTFVLPATQPGGDATVKQSNFALQHTPTPGWESFRHAFGSVLGATDVKAFSSLSKKARAIDVALDMQLDIDVVHLKRFDPLKPALTGIECLVSFGSPASNVLTRWICNTLMKDPLLPRFADNAVATQTTAPGATSPMLLQWRPDLLDYAILARLTGPAAAGKPKTYFVCAGVDQAGSLYTAHTLFDDWETLRRETGDRDFVFVYEIDRAHLTNEETYGQAQTTRKSAFVKTAQDRWEDRSAELCAVPA